jgi:methylated-DNA-[protein]-cysteine S-methyltransferase
VTVTRCRTFESPLGPLTVAGIGDVITNLRMTGQTYPPPDQERWRDDPRAFSDVIEQLRAYFDGSLTGFEITLELIGPQFHREVWSALLEIPYGETRSYGEIASQIGRPGAARAVGRVNGLNPVAIIVPCHRVIGADGSLTGYGGGLHRKRALLQLEQDYFTPRLALSQ